MHHLEITTLGALQASLDGQSLAAFRTDKVRALLVFLAVEAYRPHRREALAGMFWPERPAASARNNLRQALYQLREAIGDPSSVSPFLRVTPNEIQFNSGSDCRLDVKQFSAHLAVPQVHHPGGLSLCGSCLDELRQAAALYGGDFLAGFSLPGCSEFEWWLLSQQEHYHRRALEILARLGSYYEGCGDYRQAGFYSLREIELEPWREAAHRRRMRALALSGERNTALRQYESCRAILAQEMGIEPSKRTRELYEEIRAGGEPSPEETRPPKSSLSAPPIHSWAPLPSIGPFVGFEPELARLENHLEAALSGRARVAFICGEAGSGKTTLMDEFIRRALAAHGGLLAAVGGCNAQFGYGDPYFPFRQALYLLTGDLEGASSVGALGEEHAARLWSALPEILEALLKEGPELVGALLPLEALPRGAQGLGEEGAKALVRLKAQARRRSGEQSDRRSQSLQVAFFDQFTRVLLAIARQFPLILGLDDLHWADRGSLSLLFHLARNLREGRVLVIGTYRPEEIALDRSGGRHPMQTLVNELLAQYGEVRVNLSHAMGWDFVNALLDSEPNDLDAAFRRKLYELTEGHPLFTVEQLRGMQESGGLVRDKAGRWVAGEDLDWESIPARVEAVIVERLARPSAECRAILEAASVKGETFSAETLAIVLGESEARLVETLSSKLCRQHRLVFAEGIQRLGETTRSRYRFRHALYQRQLYQSLDPVRRARLHQATGEALERLYSQTAGDVTIIEASAARLALHFEKAGVVEKAIRYHQVAGEEAYRLAANEDAISHFNRALELLGNMPESSELIQQELLLLFSLIAALNAARGYAEPELQRLFTRVGELAAKSGEINLVSQALYLKGSYHLARAEYQDILEAGAALMGLFLQESIPWISDLANFLIGVGSLNMGELTHAREHLEKIKPGAHSDQISYSQSPVDRVRLVSPVFLSWAYWLLGYPDKALWLSRQLLNNVRRSGYLYPFAFTLGMSTCLIHAFRGEFEELHKHARELVELSSDKGFGPYLAWGQIFLGKAQVHRGDIGTGLANIQVGLQGYRDTGHISALTILLAMQAETYTVAGRNEEALQSLFEAIRIAEETGEHIYEAELHRLRGELLIASGDEDEVESYFQKSLKIARKQQAKSLELRTTASLMRLWEKRSREAEARPMLEEVFSWFNEGFRTQDLQGVKELLSE